MAAATSVSVAPSIKKAVAARKPVVALESAVITHGLPRDAALSATRKQWEACEKAGAVPGVVAVFDGALRIGLTLDECHALAERLDAAKVSPWNLAASLVHPGFGGTTVAATIVGAALSGIRIVSTGGIGGVHPGDGRDVSSDLTELGKRQVCVVCAGPKSTLDAVATLEELETLGVPVVGWQSSVLAGFLATSAGLRLSTRVDSIDDLASLLRRHWDLGGAGVVVSQPLPSELAVPRVQLIAASDEGLERGPGRTPAELGRLQTRLGQVVIDANVELLERNAALAAQIAVALARR